jgi:hypothetical protein
MLPDTSNIMPIRGPILMIEFTDSPVSTAETKALKGLR